MAFNAAEFLEYVTWEAFDELKKPDLMSLAKELKLDVKHAMRKHEIKNMFIDRLVDDDDLDGFCLDHKVLVDGSSESTVKLKQLEIQNEMEMAKLQLQKEKLEMEKVFKQQELDAKFQMEQKEREDRLAMEERIKTKEIEAKVQMEKRLVRKTRLIRRFLTFRF